MNRWPIQPGAPLGAPRRTQGGRAAFRILVWWAAFCLLLSACATPGEAPQATVAPQTAPGTDARPTRTPFPTRKSPAGTRTPTANPSGQPGEATELSTTGATGEAGGAVTLTFGGALNIRRGPGLAYDAVAAFKAGETAQARGRDGQGEWLQVEVPNSPGVLGWVYSKAPVVVVQGDPLSLPEATYNEAVPAYVRNCTTHQLSLRPGEYILEPIARQPANRQQIYPGFYEVVDLTLNAATVMTLAVTEGSELVITKDGKGVNYACPY